MKLLLKHMLNDFSQLCPKTPAKMSLTSNSSMTQLTTARLVYIQLYVSWQSTPALEIPLTVSYILGQTDRPASYS